MEFEITWAHTDKLLADMEFVSGLTNRISPYDNPTVDRMETFLESLKKDLSGSEYLKIKKALKLDYANYLKTLKQMVNAW